MIVKGIVRQTESPGKAMHYLGCQLHVGYERPRAGQPLKGPDGAPRKRVRTKGGALIATKLTRSTLRFWADHWLLLESSQIDRKERIEKIEHRDNIKMAKAEKLVVLHPMQNNMYMQQQCSTRYALGWAAHTKQSCCNCCSSHIIVAIIDY